VKFVLLTQEGENGLKISENGFLKGNVLPDHAARMGHVKGQPLYLVSDEWRVPLRIKCRWQDDIKRDHKIMS